ncbi:MAG: glutaredoxin family protein [Burkholderiaceae bacterium]
MPVTLCFLFYFESILSHFILYSRSYCHLCDDMLAALQALSKEFVFHVLVVDIDADESLVAQYDELVPVLAGGKTEEVDMVQLCHYFLDVDKVRAFLLENSTS